MPRCDADLDFDACDAVGAESRFHDGDAELAGSDLLFASANTEERCVFLDVEVSDDVKVVPTNLLILPLGTAA